MADRVGFVLGGSDGLLAHFLAQSLQDFHHWYRETLGECPEEVDAARWRLLETLIKQGPSALQYATPTAINLLLMDYYGSYANVHGLTQNLHEYWDKLAYHQLLLDAFRRHGHTLIAELLARTVMGRLPIPDPTFPMNDWRDYQLSFWTADEVMTLHWAVSELSHDAVASLTDDEGIQHALQTIREALDIAASHSTGLIIFVGW